MSETEEIDSCFEEESALSESGFGDLVCKYNIYSTHFLFQPSIGVEFECVNPVSFIQRFAKKS